MCDLLSLFFKRDLKFFKSVFNRAIITIAIINSLVFNAFVVRAQFFTPLVTNYSQQHYLAGSQNWSVATDTCGVMYFGNNNGLLQYDGINWDLFKLPRGKVVRSVMVDVNNQVFVGSFEEFGYFQKNMDGTMFYTSISSKLKDYKMQNDEIWSIIRLNKYIYFFSFNSYFIYDGETVLGYRTSDSRISFSLVDNAIYAFSEQNGLSLLNDQMKIFNARTDRFVKGVIVGVLPFHNNGLLLVSKGGLFIQQGNSYSRFAPDVSDIIIKANPNKAILISDSIIVVGTILNGIFALDKSGSLLWHLNTENGLLNNTILGLSTDKAGDLWVAMDKGISMIHIKSPLKVFNSIKSKIGTIYAAAISNHKLYIGTNQGLYEADYDTSSNNAITNAISFKRLTFDHVWHITKIDNQLFFGNNASTFSIANDKIIPLHHVNGGLVIKKGVIDGKEVLIEGTYSQLVMHTKNSNGEWSFSHAIENFSNPVRFVEIDYQGNIWCSHLHKGIYKIRLTSDLMSVQSIKHYPSISSESAAIVNVFKVNNRVVFLDLEQFYTYDDISETLIPFDKLNDSLPAYKNSRAIVEVSLNHYWFINDVGAALVKVTDDEVVILNQIMFSNFQIDVSADEFAIMQTSDLRSLFCFGYLLGFYNNSFTTKKISYKTPLFLKDVHAQTQKGVVLHLPVISTNHYSVSHQYNNFQFTISYPNFADKGHYSFRYFLDGYNGKQYADGFSRIANYYNLSAGDYVFQAKVIDESGKLITELSYPFSVNPPFLLSWPAIFLYIGLMLLLLYWLVGFIHRRVVKTNSKLLHEQQLQQHAILMEKQQTIMSLENEKLEAELNHKGKEIASTALSIIHKNEVLSAIKDELTEQKKNLGVHYPNKYFEKIIHLIDNNLTVENDWVLFQTNFDLIHDHFFRNLKHTYSDLSPNDLRLCALLRLNLTTKNIASLMNVSAKGVEIGRYRLRKKLGISSETSLTNFLIEFK